MHNTFSSKTFVMLKLTKLQLRFLHHMTVSLRKSITRLMTFAKSDMLWLKLRLMMMLQLLELRPVRGLMMQSKVISKLKLQRVRLILTN